MSKSHVLRRTAAVVLTGMSLSGAVATIASPAQADVFKELEYRGNTSRLVMTARSATSRGQALS